MPPTFDCGGFDCGDAGINAALRGELLTAIGEGRVKAFYVEEDGQCLGFIALRVVSLRLDSIDREVYALSSTEAPAALLELLAVDSQAQGRGLGAWLVDAALQLAQQAGENVGLRFLVLNSLRHRVSFYEAHGFDYAYSRGDTDTVRMLFDLRG